MMEYFRFREIHELYLRGQVDDARRLLSELQARYVGICDENSLLRAQVDGYEEVLHLARSLVFDGIFFWLITGSVKQGPFCPVCYNRDGLLLRLADDSTSRYCLTCGSTFKRSIVPLEEQKNRQAVSGMAQGFSADPAETDFTIPASGRKATVLPFSRQGATS